MRTLAGILLALTAAAAFAQTDGAPQPRQWSFYASAFSFFVPDDDDYVSPVVTADGGWLHLEGRYNYEGRSTGSLWVGYNFVSEDETTWEVTPMIGVAGGDVAGIAPGVEITLQWKSIGFYTEGEYLFATDDEDDFLYFWSELAWSPNERFRLGLVSQRTRAWESELDVQRGVLAGVSFGAIAVTGHVFNAGWTDPTYVISIGAEF